MRQFFLCLAVMAAAGCAHRSPQQDNAKLPKRSTLQLSASELQQRQWHAQMRNTRTELKILELRQMDELRAKGDLAGAEPSQEDDSSTPPLGPSAACGVWQQLSQEKSYRLRWLASARFEAHCSANVSTAPNVRAPEETLITKETKQTLAETPSSTVLPEWARFLHLGSVWRKAAQGKDADTLAAASLGFLSQLSRRSDQLALIEYALSFSPSFALREQLESERRRISPRWIKDPAPSQYINVGNDFLRDRKFSEGRKWLEKAKNHSRLSFEERLRAWTAWRASFRQEQARDQFVGASKKMSQWTELKNSPQLLGESLLHLARAQWTAGERKSATTTLRRLQALDVRWQAQSLWLQARMAEEARNWRQAIQQLQQAREAWTIDSWGSQVTQLRTEIGWNLAWISYKTGDYTLARTQLLELVEQNPDHRDTSKWLFWMGRAEQVVTGSNEAPSSETATSQNLPSQNPSLASQKIWENLIARDPFGYYGLLAHRALGKDLPLLQQPSSASQLSWPRSGISKQVLQLQEDLALAGEPELLVSYWNASDSDQASEDAKWMQSLYLAKAGQYLPLFNRLGTLAIEDRNLWVRDFPDLVFPLVGEEVIQSAAIAAGLDPNLVFGLIRQESAFDSSARSPADAMGWMQILPQSELARKNGVRHFDDLLDPKLNAKVGTQMLSDLVRKHSGQFLLAIANYNANSTSVRGWIKSRHREDPVEFIEEIPFEETRGYVRIVLRNWIVYGLRRQDPTQPSQKFPEHLLHWKLPN